MINGSILAAGKVADSKPINLDIGEKYVIREETECIFQLVNRWLAQVVFDPSKTVGRFGITLDIGRVLLGWAPKITFEDGLRRTANWYLRLHPPKGYLDQTVLMEGRGR